MHNRIISIERLRYLKCLVMQKTLVKVMHDKIVFVKVESSVIGIYESVH